MSPQKLICIATVALLISMVVDTSVARQTELGTISFPNSGDAAAQNDFVEGVLFLHSFEYESAANAFRRAQEADPDFVLAYWGEAMTFNHPVWFRQYPDDALGALSQLGATADERAGKATTGRERDLLGAVEILYGTVPSSADLPKDDRDDLYSAEMYRLMALYPEDLEIRAFYALSILGTAHEGRDFATYMKAAAVVTPVWDANRDHPGAAHYLIHSYDDPIHAPLGLPMARAYSVIAPNAAHAQHMTSHIFVAMGLWDDVISANIVASRVSKELNEKRGRKESVCGHYTFWLEYGYLQTGDFEDARSIFDACYERQSDSPTGSERGYFASMRARMIFDTEDWSIADHYDSSSDSRTFGDAEYGFASAFAALKLGDTEAAETFVANASSANQLSDEQTIYKHQLQGLLAQMKGETETAEEHLVAAVDHEASLPFEFGPPTYVKPAFELLGQFYLEIGKLDEAREAFQAQLDRTPHRRGSVLGLNAAAELGSN